MIRSPKHKQICDEATIISFQIRQNLHRHIMSYEKEEQSCFNYLLVFFGILLFIFEPILSKTCLNSFSSIEFSVLLISFSLLQVGIWNIKNVLPETSRKSAQVEQDWKNRLCLQEINNSTKANKQTNDFPWDDWPSSTCSRLGWVKYVISYSKVSSFWSWIPRYSYPGTCSTETFIVQICVFIAVNSNLTSEEKNESLNLHALSYIVFCIYCTALGSLLISLIC